MCICATLHNKVFRFVSLFLSSLGCFFSPRSRMCVYVYVSCVRRVVSRIQTLSTELFDSHLMSSTCRRIAQSLTLIARATERERKEEMSPPWRKKRDAERISGEKVNNAGTYQWRNDWGGKTMENIGSGRDCD